MAEGNSERFNRSQVSSVTSAYMQQHLIENNENIPPASEFSGPSFLVIRQETSQTSSSSRRPPPTPVSNFSLEVPNISSGSSASGNGSDDENLESIFPKGSEFAISVQERARRMAEESLSLGPESERILEMGVSCDGDISSERVIGDNGTIYSELIRQRRRLLEGRPDDGQKEVVMCVFWASRKIAASYYDLETAELFFLPDMADSAPDFGLLRTLFDQIRPTYVIANKSSDDRFLEVIHELSGHKFVTRSGNAEGDENMTGNDEDEIGLPHRRNSSVADSITLYLLRPRDFSVNECKLRVQALKLPSEPKNLGPKEHLYFIASLIPFSNNDNLIRAMGCLLKFLDKNAIELFQIELVGAHIPVTNVELLQMNEIVLVENTAWESLQIFNTEFHPSSLKQGTLSSSKEGLSVYSLLNQCVTTQGAKKLRQMLLRPSRNEETLHRRYDSIDFFMNPNNFDFVKSLTDCLKSVKSIPKLLYRISVLHATVNEWRELYQTLYNCLLLSGMCSSLEVAPAFLQHVGSTEFYQVLNHLSQQIIRTVDFEKSMEAGRIVAQYGLDPELDKKKKQLDCLPEVMSIVASEEMDDLPDFVPRCCAVYIPEVGYLLAVSVWKEDLTDDECVIENLEYRFKTNELVYYKSARMREMDVIFGDCSVFALEKETGLMVNLTNVILEKSSILYKLSDCVSELDCLISMAAIARSSDFVRPVLAPGHGKMNILDGRHPLSDMIREFVPNTTRFQESEHVAVLTGPNASGKSIYLKQVGIITIMALCGSFVPAKFARIPLVDKIFTRIHAKESVSSGFSTFMIDLNQMALSLRSCTRNSLVIIDEFGKGTAEVDGLSLLTASLKEFIDRGEDCPTVFLSTHFFSIINLLNLEASPLVRLQTMKFIEEEGKITYLYRLEDGYCNRSFARIIAQFTGSNPKVLARATEVEKVTKGEEEPAKLVVRKNSRQLSDEDLSVSIADEFLQLDLKDPNFDPVAYLSSIRKRVDDWQKVHDASANAS